MCESRRDLTFLIPEVGAGKHTAGADAHAHPGPFVEKYVREFESGGKGGGSRHVCRDSDRKSLCKRCVFRMSFQIEILTPYT